MFFPIAPLKRDDDTVTAQRWATNPRFTGLRCLHCSRDWPLALQHSGCPVCSQTGVHVSLAAAYTSHHAAVAQASSGYAWGSHLPYTQGVSLGEGNTPLTDQPRLALLADVARLALKDESQNPTGSHKDRMSALGITQALAFGAHTVVLASSGNAAISAARYAKAAGLACEVATYDGMPAAYVAQLDAYGAKRFMFEDNTGRWDFVRERAALPGYFALTNYHLPALGSAPLAIEGYKNIAFECFADGYVPGHIMVPTARGDLAWGIYAGFADLLVAKQIKVLPKMWIVEPFARLTRVLAGDSLHSSYAGSTAQFSTSGATVTYLQWQAAQLSGGGAVVVSDSSAYQARHVLRQHGIDPELCAAAGFGAVKLLRAEGRIAADAHVLCLLTANASKDPSSQASHVPGAD